MKTTKGFRPICLIHLLLVAIIINGCSTTPKLPQVLDGGPLHLYYTDEFTTDFNGYKAAYVSGDIAKATAMRNAMLQRIRVEIETNYRDFEAKLFGGREAFLTATDFIELGLAGATTIVVGERAKTVLAAVLTAVKGASLSVDKNWFREKNVETIIASMQAERNKKMETIQSKLIGNATEYPFEEAWVDLIDYFYAGTLEGGIQALTVETGKNAADAKVANRAATAKRVAHFRAFKKTTVQINKRGALTDKVKQLQDGNQQAEAEKIAKALNLPVNPPSTVYDVLQQKIRDADDQGEQAVDDLLAPFGIKTN